MIIRSEFSSQFLDAISRKKWRESRTPFATRYEPNLNIPEYSVVDNEFARVGKDFLRDLMKTKKLALLRKVKEKINDSMWRL